MPSEVALLESRALRVEHQGRVEVLDKVKALVMLPDDMHVTTEGVARYFEVHRGTVHNIARRHRDELEANGMVTLKGSELQSFEVFNLNTSKESYPQGRAHLRLYTRRTVLNVAMLLRDSDIARCVRTYLLDAEEAGGRRQDYASLDRRVTKVEANLDTVGHALQDLGPVINGISVRLDRRLDATNQVVGAMSNRLCDLSDDMRRMDRRMDDFAHQLRELQRSRRRKRR
ncbi:hypothetical protein OG735_20960 [Streptomyces sp. NBC_01210]|uniref:hypothetical protein n=1 Tax=Streptomyces sp. NBC_01210 TaxID=2903774 RepID=UPI002E11309B|nr:hypothetical protein OG735_20960 [Streptomyces sp. NBC_01210]